MKMFQTFLAFIALKILNFFPEQFFLPQFKVRIQFDTKQWVFLFPFAGQKFAMLELKSTISQVLRSFKVIERDSKEDLHATLHFVLKSTTGVKVKLETSPERLVYF